MIVIVIILKMLRYDKSENNKSKLAKIIKVDNLNITDGDRFIIKNNIFHFFLWDKKINLLKKSLCSLNWSFYSKFNIKTSNPISKLKKKN